jgi:hypothetical protein
MNKLTDPLTCQIWPITSVMHNPRAASAHYVAHQKQMLHNTNKSS